MIEAKTTTTLRIDMLTRPTGVWKAPLVMSRLVAGGTSCCLCGALVSPLSERVSPEQSGGVPLPGLGPRIDMLPVVCSGRCSGGTSNLGVDAGLQGRPNSSLHANSLKVGAHCVAVALVLRRFAVVGTVFLSLVRGSGLRGACRDSHEQEDGRPVALKTD